MVFFRKLIKTFLRESLKSKISFGNTSSSDSDIDRQIFQSCTETRPITFPKQIDCLPCLDRALRSKLKFLDLKAFSGISQDALYCFPKQPQFRDFWKRSIKQRMVHQSPMVHPCHSREAQCGKRAGNKSWKGPKHTAPVFPSDSFLNPALERDKGLREQSL